MLLKGFFLGFFCRFVLCSKSSELLFDDRLVEVIRYCWLKRKDPAFQSLEPVFDMENYAAVTKKQHALDRYHCDTSFFVHASNAAFSNPNDLQSSNGLNFVALAGYASNVNLFENAWRDCKGDQRFFTTSNGLTVAHVAAMFNTTETINFLAQNRPAVLHHKSTLTGMTPLHFAIIFESACAVDALLRNSASVDDVDWRGFTAFDLAAIVGNGRVLKLILEYLATVNRFAFERDYYGLHKATIVAARWGYLEVAAFLNKFTFKHYQIIDPKTGCNLLHLACKASGLDTIKGFLKKIRLANSKSPNHPLFYAIANKNYCAFQAFCPSNELTCLDVAVESGDIGAVRAVLDECALRREAKQKAVDHAIKVGQLKAAIYLLLELEQFRFTESLGACKPEHWQTLTMSNMPLPRYALITGNVDLLESLLSSGLEPSFRLDNGMSAMEYANNNGLYEIVAILQTFQVVEKVLSSNE